MRPFWSGTITFGLVSVPVNLFPANQSNRTPLRMLGPEGEPLARRYYSQETGRDLDPDQMVRGYEYEKDKYLVITDDELERLAPEKTRDINLTRFVPEDSIPPVYFERGYFLTPAAESEKAYTLLAQTMKESHQAGIATFVMRGKEYLVAIFSDNGLLRAETMRFPDELRSPKDIGLPAPREAAPAAVRKFEKLISKKSKKAVPAGELVDKQNQALLKLVNHKKTSRANVVEVEEEREAGESNVVDIMDVLKQSLAAKKKQVGR